jgi:hypothetical protein
MTVKRPSLLCATALSLMLALPVGGAALLMTAATPALAQASLPAPYVSRALNAVLLPIDDSVRDTFGLSAEDAGVFILATAPGGLADAAGLAPGDTIDYVRGAAILSPADLDAVVWNWINTGVSEFVFDGRRAGQSIAATTFITTEIWFTEISVSEIYSWSSYSSESFSYESYYEEYSEEISMSYSESSAEYSEEITSEDGVDEMTDDEILEQSMAEEATGDYTDDAVDCAGEIIDGVCDEGMDEMTEEPMEDEPVEEEVVEDEVIDEGGDAGGDEGGDEGYIEE